MIPEIEETVDEMTFRAPFMTCTEVQKRTLTLTRMMPGSLSADGVSGAQFYNEGSRVQLGTSQSSFHQLMEWMIVYFIGSLTIAPIKQTLQEVSY